jgi:hypothetical protein
MRYWRENLPILLWIMILGCAGIIGGYLLGLKTVYRNNEQ